MSGGEDSRPLLGACGLYCGACYHHRAAFPQGKHLLADAERQGRDLNGFTCGGCRSDALYVHAGCSQCEIRACADGRNFEHCGLCPDSPCKMLTDFQNNGRPHHRDVLAQLTDLAAIGTDRWLAEQRERWTCRCGSLFSWYEESCHTCGEPLRSYGKAYGR